MKTPRQPSIIQTIEAYEDDLILNHLYNTLVILARLGFVYFGIACILEYRERMYPKLFPMSIDINKLDGTQSTKTNLYIELLKNRV